MPAAIPVRLAEAVARFSWAVASQDEPAASTEHAEAALQAAIAAGDLLAAAYAEQALVVRRRNGGKVAGLLGAELGTTLLDDYTARQVLRSFNAAEVPLCWRETESTRRPFLVGYWRCADSVVSCARAESACRAALDARPPSLARLAVPLRRRL